MSSALLDPKSNAAAHTSGGPPEVDPEAQHMANMDAYNADTEGSRLKLFCSCCLNLYLCNFFGHKFHISELFCLGAVALCVVGAVFVLSDAGLPAYAFSIGLCVYSIIAIIFVWDYATVASLAAIATRLEGIAKRARLEAGKYSIINDSLEDQASTYKSQLGLLGDETAGIDIELGSLQSLIPKLEEMQDVHEALNRRQIELGDQEEQFAAESQLAVADKAKEIVKTGVKVLFESFPKVPYRHGVTPYSEDRVVTVREYLKANSVPITSEINAVFNRKTHIFCQDVVEYIDRTLSTRFYRLKFAADQTAAMEKEVTSQRVALDHLKAKSKRLESGIIDKEDRVNAVVERERAAKELSRTRTRTRKSISVNEKPADAAAVSAAVPALVIAPAPSGPVPSTPASPAADVVPPAAAHATAAAPVAGVADAEEEVAALDLHGLELHGLEQEEDDSDVSHASYGALDEPL